MVTRVYKLNSKINEYNKNLKELSEVQTECKQKTEVIQNKLKESSREIDLFKGMTDEQFNKTKYRDEAFVPI